MTLLETINTAANYIHRKNLRGPGNLLVIHEDLLETMESMELYKSDKERNLIPEFDSAVEKAGTLNNRYDVLICNDMPTHQILVAKLGDGLQINYTGASGATIPKINFVLASNPKFIKNELSFWTLVNIVGKEII